MVKVINIDTKTRTIRVENAADGDIKTWRTTESGAHFPIKKGESTKEALDKFVEKKRGAGIDEKVPRNLPPELKKKEQESAKAREKLQKDLRKDVFGPAKKEELESKDGYKYKKNETVEFYHDAMHDDKSKGKIVGFEKTIASHGNPSQNQYIIKMPDGSTRYVEEKLIDWAKGEKANEPGSLKESATEWYAKKYKRDKEMAPKGTFEDIYASIKQGKDPFDDSIVRERVFEEMSKRLNKPYEHLYDMWLHGGEKGSQARIEKQNKTIAEFDKLLKTDLDPDLKRAIIAARDRAKKDIQ